MKVRSSIRAKTTAKLFTASMADVVFLLIVFFILTLRVAPDGTRVTLPQTMIRSPAPEDAAVISVAQPDNGSVIRVSSGTERSLAVASDEEVATFAANVVAAHPERAFIIKADHRVPYARIDAVLDALKMADAKLVYLLSDQKATTTNSP